MRVNFFPWNTEPEKSANDYLTQTDVFEKLNQGGKTVIIVTHDMEVAARCGRVIEISDGEIV